MFSFSKKKKNTYEEYLIPNLYNFAPIKRCDSYIQKISAKNSFLGWLDL